jgi:endonuclease G
MIAGRYSYVLGYSYYFRQAKWAIEIVDSRNTKLERSGSFRPDYRIPEIFRADLVDYAGSGFDRGHLVASTNKRGTELENSETFLLSNMSPQRPRFNRDIWQKLETRVRELDAKPKVLETFVICGPIFNFDQAVVSIGTDDENDVTIPVPHAYFTSVLTENNRGKIKMWSFMMANEESSEDLEAFQVPTTKVEQYAGIKLWDRLEGSKIDREKKRVRKMWR